MKKITLLSMLLVSILSFSQEKKSSLSNFFKIEGFIDKIGIGYEYPINDRLLLDLNTGIGGANIIYPNEISYKLGKDNDISYSGIFIKGQLRYYISRENRENKTRSLVNNAGSFIGIQSKFNFNGNKDYIGKTLLTDVHFGQQLPLGNRFIFRYHIGVGYANNFDLNYNTLYPAFNFTFGYTFK